MHNKTSISGPDQLAYTIPLAPSKQSIRIEHMTFDNPNSDEGLKLLNSAGMVLSLIIVPAPDAM